MQESSIGTCRRWEADCAFKNHAPKAEFRKVVWDQQQAEGLSAFLFPHTGGFPNYAAGNKELAAYPSRVRLHHPE